MRAGREQRRMCGRQPGPYTACSGSRWSSATGSDTSTPPKASSTRPTARGLGRDEVGRQGEDGLAEPCARIAGEPADRRARAPRRGSRRRRRAGPPAPGRRSAPTGRRRGTRRRRNARLRCSSVSPPRRSPRLSRPMRRDSPPASRTPIRTAFPGCVQRVHGEVESSSCGASAAAAAAALDFPSRRRYDAHDAGQRVRIVEESAFGGTQAASAGRQAHLGSEVSVWAEVQRLTNCTTGGPVFVDVEDGKIVRMTRSTWPTTTRATG